MDLNRTAVVTHMYYGMSLPEVKASAAAWRMASKSWTRIARSLRKQAEDSYGESTPDDIDVAEESDAGGGGGEVDVAAKEARRQLFEEARTVDMLAKDSREWAEAAETMLARHPKKGTL